MGDGLFESRAMRNHEVNVMKITVEQAAGELLGKDNILILCHANPDGDTMGCGFAMWHALTALGKHARVECSDEFPARFSFLYEGYHAEEFREEYIVAVDIAAVQLFGARMACYSDRVNLCIDHHPSNEMYAEKTCLHTDAAAACEIVDEVIACMGVPLSQKMADCLYTGIATDTGCFKFSGTTANTHRIAADLFEHGANYMVINEFLFDTKSRSRVTVEQQVLGTMEFFEDGRIAVIGITREMIARAGADEAELDGVSSLPRMIEGVLIGVTIREKADGSHKVSVRTNREVDASQVCRKFGGGGHARAAGCSLKDDYDTTKQKLVEVCKQFLPN